MALHQEEHVGQNIAYCHLAHRRHAPGMSECGLFSPQPNELQELKAPQLHDQWTLITSSGQYRTSKQP